MKINVKKPNVNKKMFGPKNQILDSESSYKQNVQKWC